MQDMKLIERLHDALRASLRAELLAEGVVFRLDVERIAMMWLVIAQQNHGVEWWDFLPGDSEEDGCRRFAAEWMTAKAVTRAPSWHRSRRLRQLHAFVCAATEVDARWAL
jgi:hypothetical protein